MGPTIHPDLERFSGLIGLWRGKGHGTYPTTEPFTYAEEIEFAVVGQEPYLAYAAHSWNEPGGAPIHLERGFLFPGPEPGLAELALAHPVGVTEIATGTIAEGSLELMSTTVSRTPSGSAVAGLARHYTFGGDELTYDVDMAMDEVAMVFHVHAQLRRAT